MPGLTDATKRVADHARSLVQLELQLALTELKRKAIALGAGIGLTLVAAVVNFFALAFALAGGTAFLATHVRIWVALLLVAGGLVLASILLALLGIMLLRRGSRAVPEAAIKEAQLTREMLRGE